MNTALKIATLLIGFGLISSGLLKNSGQLESFGFDIGGLTCTIPIYSGWFYVNVINFIGGVSMVVYSILSLVDGEKVKKLNWLKSLTKILVVFVSMWINIENLILLELPFKNIGMYWPFLFAWMLVLMPIGGVPLFLVYSQNNTSK